MENAITGRRLQWRARLTFDHIKYENYPVVIESFVLLIAILDPRHSPILLRDVHDRPIVRQFATTMARPRVHPGDLLAGRHVPELHDSPWRTGGKQLCAVGREPDLRDDCLPLRMD